jgi:hypothetical protein
MGGVPSSLGLQVRGQAPPRGTAIGTVLALFAAGATLRPTAAHALRVMLTPMWV